VVAVQQGIGAFFMLGMSDPIGLAYSPVGILAKYLLQPRAQAYRQKTEATLQKAQIARFRAKPNVVFQTPKLKAITFKFKKGAPVVSSDLVVETKTGSKQRYGINPADFEKVYPQLQQLYPGLCSSI
jgi:hypothetical protein